MRNALVTTLVIGGIAVALAAGVRGQAQAVPGPGSGVVTVTGTVQIADGMIHAAQVGDWKVAVANAPDVRVVNTPTVARAAWPFLRQGAQVTVTWPDGSTESIRIAQLGGAGGCREAAAAVPGGPTSTVPGTSRKRDSVDDSRGRKIDVALRERG